MVSTEKIFSEFKEHSVAEFFKKNKQMLGFSGKIRSLTTIVHEYVTNSLDACEEARILPDIKVEIFSSSDKEGVYKVRVEDNGPGIPKQHLGKALGMMLAGTKFHRYAQQRGQQGIGASGCTMYAQLTTGKPILAVSRYDKKKITCNISIDFKTNRPNMENMVEEDLSEEAHGLVIEGEFGECKYDKSSYGVFEYIKRTALANPHANILFVGPDGQSVTFPRSSEEIPPKPKEVLPHPLGLSTYDIIDYAHRDTQSTRISSFLQSRFSRVSSSKVKELEAIAKGVDFKKKPTELEWAEAEELVNAIKSVKWIAPATDSLIPIGKAQIEKSLKNILNPQFLVVSERSPKIYRGGVPFLVEIALAYGGDAGRQSGDIREGDIIRYANRAPLVFDSAGCAITKAVKEIDWRRYGIRDFDQEPLTVFINLVSVHVPYTGAGKQAIAEEEEIVSEIKNAVMETARQLQKYLHGLIRESEKSGRKKAIMRYVSQLALDLAELSGEASANELEKRMIKLIEEKFSSLTIEEDSEEYDDEPVKEEEAKEEDL
ncbi:MAG: DNA topoisomerase VI subunit B [Candidatus Anstonellales archaeon]